MDTPKPAQTDTTDWTFVIDKGCPECGYAPHDPRDTAERLRAMPERWEKVLNRKDATERPGEDVWSPVEYARHCLDLLRVLNRRVTSMLNEENPQLEDFDGEAEAVNERFWEADPERVSTDIADAVREVAATYDRIGEGEWGRTGVRSDGKLFTILGMSRYLLHDLEHHLVDVRG
ncbi:MAG: DinB family protein [Flaviflexus sp.]|uniref:DinB family protein n=1 Tax=Flaviflexus sp. TaxID=1969482 RepID=UPI003F9343D4